jgi:transposase
MPQRPGNGDIAAIIPVRSNHTATEHSEYRRYRARHRIERMFGLRKRQRRIASRYDKTATAFFGFLNIAAARLWTKACADMGRAGNSIHAPSLLH